MFVRVTTTRQNASRGFTLLEALVVLILTSLISVVLVQGFGLVLAARTSVENKLVDIDQRVLERNVFLEPLRGILPDFPERPNVFGGDARRLHGLTVRPLEERFGMPVGFSLWLDYDRGDDQTTLNYQENGSEAVVLDRWEGDRGNFSYRDLTGPWSPTWPPPSPLLDTAGQTPQTPWLIRIMTGKAFPSTMVASVAGVHLPPLRMLDAGAVTSPTP